MSSIVYPYGTDLSNLSGNLLKDLNWPNCFACGGFLILPMNSTRPLGRGKCKLANTLDKVQYIIIDANFYCTLCIEHHIVSWYFFYALEYKQSILSSYSLIDNCYARIRIPRFNIEKLNEKVHKLLSSTR